MEEEETEEEEGEGEEIEEVEETEEEEEEEEEEGEEEEEEEEEGEEETEEEPEEEECDEMEQSDVVIGKDQTEHTIHAPPDVGLCTILETTELHESRMSLAPQSKPVTEVPDNTYTILPDNNDTSYSSDQANN